MMNDNLADELYRIGESYVAISDLEIELYPLKKSIDKDKDTEENRIIKEYSLSCAKKMGLEKNVYDDIILDFDIQNSESLVAHVWIRVIALVVLAVILGGITIFFKEYLAGDLEIVVYVNVFIIILTLFGIVACFGLATDEENRRDILNKRFIKKNKENMLYFLDELYFEDYDFDRINSLNDRHEILKEFVESISHVYQSRIHYDLKKFNIEYRKYDIKFKREGRNTFLSFLITPRSFEPFYTTGYKQKFNKIVGLQKELKIAEQKQAELFNNLEYVPKKYAQNEDMIKKFMRVFIDTRPSSWNELIRTYEERAYRNQQLELKQEHYKSTLKALENYTRAQNEYQRQRLEEYKKQSQTLEEFLK